MLASSPQCTGLFFIFILLTKIGIVPKKLKCKPFERCKVDKNECEMRKIEILSNFSATNRVNSRRNSRNLSLKKIKIENDAKLGKLTIVEFLFPPFLVSGIQFLQPSIPLKFFKILFCEISFLDDFFSSTW